MRERDASEIAGKRDGEGRRKQIEVEGKMKGKKEMCKK